MCVGGIENNDCDGLEQRLLVMHYSQLVIFVIDYGLGVLIFSDSQCERLERIQNEGRE